MPERSSSAGTPLAARLDRLAAFEDRSRLAELGGVGALPRFRI